MRKIKEIKKNPPNWPKRYCEFCGEKLKRKIYSYGLECLSHFEKRKFCNSFCQVKFIQKKLGHTLWNKEKVVKEFIKIMKENKWWRKKKWKNKWIRENYPAFNSAINYYYDNWNKFLKEIGKLNKVFCNHIISKEKQQQKLIIKYWQKELDIKKGKVFEWSHNWDIPIDYLIPAYQNNPKGIAFLIWDLRKKGIIRRYKKSKHFKGESEWSYGGTTYIKNQELREIEPIPIDKDKAQGLRKSASPSQYILKKTRIN